MIAILLIAVASVTNSISVMVLAVRISHLKREIKKHRAKSEEDDEANWWKN